MTVSMVGAWRHSDRLAIPAAAAQMTLTLVFWRRMADFYEAADDIMTQLA